MQEMYSCILCEEIHITFVDKLHDTTRLMIELVKVMDHFKATCKLNDETFYSISCILHKVKSSPQHKTTGVSVFE
jgi:hypothetical protein